MKRTLQHEIALRNAEVAGLNKQSREQAAALASKKVRLATISTELEASEIENARVSGDLATRNSQVQGLTAQLATILKDKAQLAASALEMQSALRSLRDRKAESERRIAQYRSLLEKFKELIDAGTLRVSIVDGRMVLALPSDVLFSSGSAELSEAGRAAIADVASVLATLPERRFQVEGHTDNIPIRTKRFASNWELASARALTVVGEMVTAGVDPRSVSSSSYSEYRPVSDNSDDLGRARNRRIEIVMVPDLSMLPGFDELKKIVGGS